jgi:hypothetical protein
MYCHHCRQSHIENVIAHNNNLSEPISSTQINFPPLLQILHDIIDAPGLELVSSWVVRRNALIVFQFDAILEVLDNLLVILVREPFRVVFPDPLGQARRRLSWVDFDLRPIRLLQQLDVGETDFLSAGGAGESVEVDCQ